MNHAQAFEKYGELLVIYLQLEHSHDELLYRKIELLKGFLDLHNMITITDLLRTLKVNCEKRSR